MGIYAIRLPDVGEGIAEAELIEWHVSPGDTVAEDDLLATVMTDKAALEVPSSVAGTVLSLGGKIGDLIAIGAVLVRLEVEGDGNTSDDEDNATDNNPAPANTPPAEPAPTNQAPSAPTAPIPAAEHSAPAAPIKPAQPRAKGTKPLASPSVRARAKEEGIDLRHVPGSGPAGRISHDDLSRFIDDGGSMAASKTSAGKNTRIDEVPVIGMRRIIAEKMAQSKARIPHITIVEEIDMQALEDLRSALNQKYKNERPKLTLLPFLVRAIVEAVREQPDLNARYDDDAGILNRHGGVHVGIATQTPAGLNVPVVKHAEAGTLWDNAREISRLAEASRDGSVTREDLQGGTITITSLGPLGAIATTPIINYPEVAIVGVNKMQVRPVWDGKEFRPRTMMNLSCSFDHRVIDGWDAAVFVQKLKSMLETPAMLFVEG